MKSTKSNIVHSLIHFYLYSSIHISLCATGLTVFTYFEKHFTIDYNYLSFVGFSTLFVYSTHRIIGIQKINKDQMKGRYKIVKKYFNHIKIYAVTGLIGCIFFYFKLSMQKQLLLLLFGTISVLYTLPVFPSKKRLRDFSFIKILLVAIVWSFVTETIILLEHGVSYNIVGVTFIERCLFFIGITIPFDIRDMEVDQSSRVRTLPQLIGVKRAIFLACILIGLALLINYNTRQSSGIIVCYTTSILLVGLSTKTKDDWMYSGLLDGTMLIPFLYHIISQSL